MSPYDNFAYVCNSCLRGFPCYYIVFGSHTTPSNCPLINNKPKWARLEIKESALQQPTPPAKNFCSECGTKLH